MKKPPPQQQGMALMEALVASAVLGIGLVGATQLTLKTLNTASESRQHTVAQHLAQEAMDCLHAQARTGIAWCAAQTSVQVQGMRYQREARSTPRGDGALLDLHVRVQWAAADTCIDWHSSVSAVPGWLGVSSP